MDGRSDRGRRTVMRNGGLNRREDDMWVFAQGYVCVCVCVCVEMELQKVICYSYMPRMIFVK
jgi:hypothetical protein